jgi:hypothetical protein
MEVALSYRLSLSRWPLRIHRSIVDIRALQLPRHSYASRSADIAAPHLLIMPQLHLDALHHAASVFRIMLASLAARSCTSYPRSAAASRVQHCLRRHSLLILSLSERCVVLWVLYMVQDPYSETRSASRLRLSVVHVLFHTSSDMRIAPQHHRTSGAD